MPSANCEPGMDMTEQESFRTVLREELGGMHEIRGELRELRAELAVLSRDMAVMSSSIGGLRIEERIGGLERQASRWEGGGVVVGRTATLAWGLVSLVLAALLSIATFVVTRSCDRVLIAAPTEAGRR